MPRPSSLVFGSSLCWAATATIAPIEPINRAARIFFMTAPSLSLPDRIPAEGNLELDLDLVLHLHGAAHDTDRLDAEITLLERNRAPVPAVLPQGLKRDRLRSAVNRQLSRDLPFVAARRL